MKIGKSLSYVWVVHNGERFVLFPDIKLAYTVRDGLLYSTKILEDGSLSDEVSEVMVADVPYMSLHQFVLSLFNIPDDEALAALNAIDYI